MSDVEPGMMRVKSKDKKSDAIWDMVGNLFGVVAGAADAVGGAAGLSGDQTTKLYARLISGGANILGGVIGGGKVSMI